MRGRKERVPPLDWPAQAGVGGPVFAAVERFVRRRRRRRLGLAAIACAAVGAVLVVHPSAPWNSHPARPSLVSASDAGAGLPARGALRILAPERRSLPDGSIVEIGPGADLAIDYSPAARRIELRRGQALFEVRKDRQRPFIVAAGGVEVVAVGTAFCVDLQSSRVGVVVTEGRVAVKPAHPGSAAVSPAVALVDAGSEASVARGPAPSFAPSVRPVPAAEMADLLAWRAPRLVLDATPLRAVVDEVNRHSRTRLVLGDDRVGDLTVSGVLRADNVTVLVKILEQSYRVKADAGPADEIVLRRR